MKGISSIRHYAAAVYLADVTAFAGSVDALPSPQDRTKLEYCLVPRDKEYVLKHREQTVRYLKDYFVLTPCTRIFGKRALKVWLTIKSVNEENLCNIVHQPL